MYKGVSLDQIQEREGPDDLGPGLQQQADHDLVLLQCSSHLYSKSSVVVSELDSLLLESFFSFSAFLLIDFHTPSFPGLLLHLDWSSNNSLRTSLLTLIRHT